MHFISAYLSLFSFSVGFYNAWTKEFITKVEDKVLSPRSCSVYSMHTDYDLYGTEHPKYKCFQSWKIYHLFFECTTVLQISVVLLQLLTLLINGMKSVFDLAGVPLSKDDLAMKRDRDEWLLSNMLIPTIFGLLNFWTNPLLFFGKHVYFFILPLLVVYGVWVTLYEN